MGRTTKPLTKELKGIITRSCAVNTDIESQDERMDRRRALWLEAYDAGASYAQIAEPCGVSAHLVRLEVSKARGRPWALAGGTA